MAANSYEIAISCVFVLYLLLFVALLVLLVHSVKQIGWADPWITSELFLLALSALFLCLRNIWILLARTTESKFLNSYCLNVSMRVAVLFLLAPSYLLNLAIWANFVGGAYYAGIKNFATYKRFKFLLISTMLVLLAAMEISLIVICLQECINPWYTESPFFAWLLSLSLFFVTALLLLGFML